MGKRADLVLLENSPLTDISDSREIAGVFVAGRWMSLEAIQAGLDSLTTADEPR